MRILVAEDSVAYAVLYQQIFESRGHSVKITLDGEECIAAYKEQTSEDFRKPYDVVILDYSMPKKTGLDVAKEILNMRSDQKILFISSFGQELESKVAELGRNIDVLEKPFNSSNLINKVEQEYEDEITHKVILE